ncbi:NADase-type glycan-binding domain-containing protein [Streptomyces sp. NBC_00588]|uniref:NADase-type glycan-binding domain-containing protein n=1 Tax=Streptomyces sp. NBC_00588 TaxID=2975784 RepID=UPI002E81BEC4|nr:zinc ribbon domain-containing protein [Streptomyces sp. NBC_00588]WUB38774.1 zinc ribbon domain-containing protein [Streptomyces sp. NBC_00588]
MTTTQNCADCGTRAEPGQSFCDACGAVLSWTERANAAVGGGPSGGSGSRSGAAPDAGQGAASPTARTATPETNVAPPASAAAPSAPAPSAPTPSGPAPSAPATSTPAASAPAPVAPAAPAPAPVAPINSPTPTVVSHPTPPAVDDTAPTEPVPAAAAPAPAPEIPGSPAAPVDPEARTVPRPASDPDGMTDRARQLLVPVADPEPRPASAPSVAPVLPGRPALQRPQAVRAPGEELGLDGGTPCPWCSTRNRPERHFCTRCAMPMAGDDRAPGRLPWWRRLFGAGNRETPWAGDRPRLRRTFDRVLSWLGAAIVLTLLVVLAFNIPKGVQATKDHFSKRAAVQPDTWSASRSYPGHKPDLAGDKLNNTWWGPGVSESGEGQWLQAKFDEPTRLLDLIITPGVSTRPDQITQSARPHRLEATITLSNGKTVTRKITLDPGAGGQRIPFRVGTVSSVRFTIVSATGTSSKKQVAIAEIEFFGPSSANSS